MNDLQLVRLVDAVPIRRVTLSPEPGYLRLEGAFFDATSLVRVNGLEAPSFEVLSASILDVELPEVLEGEIIQTLEVLSDRFTGSPQNRLEFLLSNVRTVSGLLKVIQQYIILLLTTPGSDIFHKERGGGLLQMAGVNIDPKNPGSYTGLVLTAVDRTTRQVVSSQLTRRLPSEEKLKAVKVLDIRFEKPSLTLGIRLGFETLAGARAATGVSLG